MIPSTIIAGDTLSFSHSIEGYDLSVAGWTFTYRLVNEDNQISFDNEAYTANDTEVSWLVDASSTNSWNMGTYSWRLKASKSPEVYTVESGILEILSNFTVPLDNRTHNKKVLDALETLIEGKATKDQISYSIAGRSISRMNPAEILEWYKQYKAWYAEEVNKSQNRTGDAVVRFRA